MTAATPPTERPVIGQWVVGIDVPVVNERAVRASAGILFLAGFAAWQYSVITGDIRPLQAFGIAFALEMYLRLFVGTRWTPTLAIGTLLTRPQRPEWVEARSKQFAWMLGFGMALIGCFALGWLGLAPAIAQAICAFCLALLFAEAAFGYCLGCELARRFAREKPTLCSGDTCTYTPPKRGEQHQLGHPRHAHDTRDVRP
ncbi:uncharacterized protein DUF4395 [Microcella alkaliphila]|jgi:hypothetical protein|uniref:Uncharacterized protein DUF4395 n=1 Tax=Microcella alkaliphila TaxID=279828 RepID=A0A4Q7TNG6_9MICO|nr:DUF4395 domain-containing protein [Microcella alkaliphila]RZT62371.1 uncharacterized protein DUF4395 [Microcella alkaliphila]